MTLFVTMAANLFSVLTGFFTDLIPLLVTGQSTVLAFFTSRTIPLLMTVDFTCLTVGPVTFLHWVSLEAAPSALGIFVAFLVGVARPFTFGATGLLRTVLSLMIQFLADVTLQCNTDLGKVALFRASTTDNIAFFSFMSSLITV